MPGNIINNFNAMKKLICTLLVSACLMQMAAEEKAQTPPARFWGNQNAYLQRQANVMFDMVDQTLDRNPPQKGVPETRKLALANLDMLLHDTINDNSAALPGFLDKRVRKMTDSMGKPVTSGYELYKIYNDGFVARTPSVSIAFDIVRGMCRDKHLISDSLIGAVAEKCDILFITHNHSDHGDPGVVEMFLQAGKPVIAVPEFMPDDKRIRHIRPADGSSYKGKAELPGGKKLDLLIYPGHQDDLMNNLYVVTTPEGRTFAHVGDQYQSKSEDMEWIPGITPELPPVDALIFNCWNTRLPQIISTFRPTVAVPGHENEMGHTIDHREAFWLTFQKMEKSPADYVVMGWGECLKQP